MRSTITILALTVIGCGPSPQEKYNAETQALENLQDELAEAESAIMRAVIVEAKKGWEADPDTSESLIAEIEAKFPQLKADQERLKEECESQSARVAAAKADLGL